MKKIISMIVLVMAITFTAQAQKKSKGQQKDNFTPEQKAILALKKMTLNLDLSEGQIARIKPLLSTQMKEREEMRKDGKTSKEDRKKMTSDERFELAVKRLDKQITFKKTMKQILNEKQYDKFEKMAARKKGQKGKGKNGKKGKKNKNDDNDSD